jgi:thioredoxin 1
MVKVINNIEEIPKDKKVVIDFFAHWCGPCKRIAPEYEEFSKKYTNVEFLKVDIDESNELAEAFGIESLPTFVLIENGNIINQIKGADMETLKNSLEEMNQVVISTPPLGAIPSLPESPKD